MMCFSKGSLVTASRTALIKVQACDEYKNSLPIEHTTIVKKNPTTREQKSKEFQLIPVFTGNICPYILTITWVYQDIICIDNILYIYPCTISSKLLGFYNTGTNGISKTRHFIFILSSIRKNMDVHWIILYTNFNVQQLYQWEISLCIYILWPSLHVCNYVILNKYWIVQRLVCEKNIPYKNIIAIKDLKFSHNQIKVS